MHSDVPRSSYEETPYAALVVDALTRWGPRPAFVQGDTVLTYDETAALVSRLMDVLREKGVTAGRPVGVLSPNRPEAWIVSTAAQLLGAPSVGMHARASAEDHVYAISDCRPSVCVVDPRFAEVGRQIEEATGTPILTLGPADVGEDALALAQGRPAAPLDGSGLANDDLVEILYTGGTTGRSKGVMQSHRARAAITLAAPLAYEMPLHPVYIAAAPITHASAHFVTPTLIRGGQVVLLDGFDPAGFMTEVERTGANLSFIVPSMIYALIDHAKSTGQRMPSMERIVYGASPISPERLVAAHEVFGRIFTQIYGQTETLALGTALLSDEHDLTDRDRLMSCGRQVPGSRVELLDEDDRILPVGEIGEICIQGPGLMEGYLNQPELTAETLSGGWLHTGDMAVKDERGFFTIVDRKKDFIVSGGFNVYSREIEDVLAADPTVAAAAVIGVPDDKWGEAVKAVVVPADGSTIDSAALVARVKQAKGSVHAPKSVDVVDALPLTVVGKLDKKALRARYWGGSERRVH